MKIKCEGCDKSFEMDSDCFLTVPYSVYKIEADGNGGLFININNERDQEDTGLIIKVPMPEEIANTAIALCKHCRDLIPPVQ